MRYLTETEKKQTIPLWKACFPEDGESFLDYYYTEKARDNQILAEEAEGEPIAMIQRNPYEICWKQIYGQVDYLVGVATKSVYRGQGLMRRLLIRCLRDMHKERRPFTFLMPAAKEIYLPFGFRYIWNQPYPQLAEAEREKLQAVPVSLEREKDWSLAAEWMEQWLSGRFELYARRDVAYVKRLLQELESEAGTLSFLYEKADGRKPVGMQAFWGIQQKEQRLLYLKEGWGSQKEEKPMIMARITHLETFLEHFSLKEPGELRLWMQVADPLIPENDGLFLWYLTEKGSRVQRTEKGMLSAAEGILPVWNVGIEDLAPWLLGYEMPCTLWPKAGKTLSSQLERIRPVHGVFFDEIV